MLLILKAPFIFMENLENAEKYKEKENDLQSHH